MQPRLRRAETCITKTLAPEELEHPKTTFRPTTAEVGRNSLLLIIFSLNGETPCSSSSR